MTFAGEAGPGHDPGTQADAPAPKPKRERFYALDALRGLAIALMIFVNLAGNWSLPPTFAHSDWVGVTLADTVFPAFLEAMGTAMPYGSRTGWRRAFGRAAMLFLVGSALVSFRYGLPFGLTMGVLQLIGATYLLTWLVMRLPRVAQTPVVAAIGIGVIAAYLFFPVPGVGAGSFEPDANLGDWFDAWLGLETHPEGPHAWLPATITVYLGVLAGHISREHTGRPRLIRLAALGGGSLALGLALSPVVPVIKHLWTPTFALVTGGIALLALVLLALCIPAGSRGGVFRPLVILGGHALVAYAFAETVLARMRDDWPWPDWEPIVTERWGELTAGVLFPLAAVLTCLLLAWVMERLDIHIRL